MVARGPQTGRTGQMSDQGNGIGENAASVRADACAPFAFLGAVVDPVRNANPHDDAVVSADGSRVSVLRIRTREDWMMALAARDV